MRFGRLLAALACGFILAAGAALSADAAQARPWLCRDKPVFSSSSAMTYRVTNHGGSRWMMLLMQFEPNGAHDGFDIIATHDVAPGAARIGGSLGAGQYFAVAMRRGHGGLWICPEYVRDKDEPPSGAVSQICYGPDPSSCPVRLTVLPAAASPPGPGNTQ